MADSVDPSLSKSTSEEDWLKKLSEILSEVKKGLPASTVLALADDYSSMSEAEYLERLGLAQFGTYGMIMTDQKQDVEPFPLSNALVKTVGSLCKTRDSETEVFFGTMLRMIQDDKVCEVMLHHKFFKKEERPEWITDPGCFAILSALWSLAVRVCLRSCQIRTSHPRAVRRPSLQWKL
jgi:hypothetical protein